jgi:hypothetical protein
MQLAYRVVGCLVVVAALISITRGASQVAKPAEAVQYADVAG